MTWNYRIYKYNNAHNEEIYALREVFYDDQNCLKYNSSDILVGQSIDQIKETVNLISEAFSKDIIYE